MSAVAPAAGVEPATALPLNELLGYHDHIPLAWQLLGEAPPGGQLAHWHDHNLRLLTAAAMLDERPRRAEPDEPVTTEIERLHHKMDIVLELLAALMCQANPLPGVVAVRVTPGGISWQAADLPPIGSRVLLRIYLHSGLPSPLLWPALVQAVGEAAFESLGEACALELERYVFVRHRRSVADARSPVGREDT
ncbi:MAG: PilZ domain-containing protein [Pseudomonadota bacterium]|nr:PilZ domain-containing protein [Pseudomonadota bacterium]